MDRSLNFLNGYLPKNFVKKLGSATKAISTKAPSTKAPPTKASSTKAPLGNLLPGKRQPAKN